MCSDSHMHTRFSGDSEADPESMILASISKGLESICITDHEDMDYVFEGIEFIFGREEYFRTFSELREKYKDQIDLRIGVEIGLQPHLPERIHSFLKGYSFDYVIGSVHVIRGKDPYYRDFFDGRTDREAYREVLDETLTDISCCPDFDALGHLDYSVRYGTHREEEYSYQAFSDQIDEILRFLIEHGKGLELNTAGLKYGLPFAHPHPDILKRYRELGGEIVTIGSDAHREEHIAYGFDKVSEILEDCGFRYYAEFKNREPVFRRIK